MYGHKVIESLQYFIKYPKFETQNRKKLFLEWISDIKEAQHFYLPEIDIYKSDSFNWDLARLPYSKCFLIGSLPAEDKKHIGGSLSGVGPSENGRSTHFCVLLCNRFIEELKEEPELSIGAVCFVYKQSWRGFSPGNITIGYDLKNKEAGYWQLPWHKEIKKQALNKNEYQHFIDNEFNLISKFLNFFTTFINCKNTTTEARKPSRKLNRKRKTKNKIPLFEYKILSVKRSEIIKQNEISNNSGSSKRLHFCRGHFKMRKTGTYWWSPHIRGKNKKGIILKDYELDET